MENEIYDSDTIKETLMVLYECEDEIINKIPNDVLKMMSNKAAESNKDFYFNSEKTLEEQNISLGCRELLVELYFKYMDIC